MATRSSVTLSYMSTGPGGGGAVEWYIAPVGVTNSAVCTPFSSSVVTVHPGDSLT